MASSFVAQSHLGIRTALAIGTHSHRQLPSSVEWIESSHPLPDARSEAAARRALTIAQGVHSGEALVILLSGGASALMAAPIDGLALQDKIDTTRRMMSAGADIHALNTVRRHLSTVKGGRLAAACVGTEGQHAPAASVGSTRSNHDDRRRHPSPVGAAFGAVLRTPGSQCADGGFHSVRPRSPRTIASSRHSGLGSLASASLCRPTTACGRSLLASSGMASALCPGP